MCSTKFRETVIPFILYNSVRMRYEIRRNRLEISFERNESYTLSQLMDYFDLSKKIRHVYRMEGRFLVHDKPVKDDRTLLEEGVTVLLKEETVDWIPADKAAAVVYEDPFVCVVHKDAGCIIHGEADDNSCLNAQVARYYLDHDIHASVRPIHRLDRDTCGLVIYSKTEFFQPFFDGCISSKKIHRHYQAICFDTGKIPKRFSCHKAIGKDRHVNNRYRVSPSGKEAHTDFVLLQRKNGYALIGCTLHTGRTHQIRVHLGDFGLQLVNDPIYGRKSADFRYMGLWADEVSLIDPITERKYPVKDNIPDDYKYFREEKRV